MNIDYNFYMNDIIETARREIVDSGFKELRTVEEVDNELSQKGTTLVFINSVCGCAGGTARPAAGASLHFDYRPDNLVTVFAGQDKEATARAREYFEGFKPSSPSFAILKDGKILGMVERNDIEGFSTVEVVNKLQSLFEKYCDEI
ncbi:MAG: hypothetical protein K0S51_450 [Bacillales bacterium]|jgi:putative YphP/YqiW family bacilliredoxin|nr:hypothetical protein [Bacillales bacterium]